MSPSHFLTATSRIEAFPRSIYSQYLMLHFGESRPTTREVFVKSTNYFKYQFKMCHTSTKHILFSVVVMKSDLYDRCLKCAKAPEALILLSFSPISGLEYVSIV